MFNKNFLQITLKKLNHKPSGSTEIAHKYLACQFFWNEVHYTRVEQGTYSTESETLPWNRDRYHKTVTRPYPTLADSVSVCTHTPPL